MVRTAAPHDQRATERRCDLTERLGVAVALVDTHGGLVPLNTLAERGGPVSRRDGRRAIGRRERGAKVRPDFASFLAKHVLDTDGHIGLATAGKVDNG